MGQNVFNLVGRLSMRKHLFLNTHICGLSRSILRNVDSSEIKKLTLFILSHVTKVFCLHVILKV